MGTLAIALCLSFIIFLFVLDYRRNPPVSLAVWIPLLWVLLMLSRPVSAWLNPGMVVDSPMDVMEGSPVDRNVYLLLMAAGLIVLLFRRTIYWSSLLNNNVLILVYLFYCALSITWSDYAFTSLKRWLKYAGDFIMLLVILTEANPDEAIKRLIRQSAYVLLPLSVVLIKYYPAYGRVYHRWTGEAMYVGVATQKNGLGLLCLILGLFLSYYLYKLFREEKPGPDKWSEVAVHSVLLLLIAWLFYLAQSATSLVTYIVGAGLFVCLGFPVIRRHPVFVDLSFFLLLGLAIAVHLLVDLSPIMLSIMGKDMTLTGRTDLWADLLSVRINPFVGAGFDSFWLGDQTEWLWYRHTWKPGQAHNGYLEVYLNLGLIGVSILAAVLFSFYRKSKKEIILHADRAGLRLTFLVVALLYNMTEASFGSLHPVWFFLLLLNIEGAPERWSSQEA